VGRAVPSGGPGAGIWINAAAAVDDGELYATAGRDRTVKLWNRAGVLVRTFTGPTAEARSVAFSADGSLIACGDEHGGVYVWEMATGKRTATLLGGHKTEVLCVAFGAGGLTLFSGSGTGPNVKSAAAAVLWSLLPGT
jgi:WD40 repeat protein